MFVTLHFMKIWQKIYLYDPGMVGKCWRGGKDRKPSKLADIDISSPSGSNWILIQPSMHARKWYPGGKTIWTCENIFRACSSSPDAQLAPIIGWRLTWEQQSPNIPTDHKLQNLQNDTRILSFMTWLHKTATQMWCELLEYHHRWR